MRRAVVFARRLKSFLRASVIAEEQVQRSDPWTEGFEVAKSSPPIKAVADLCGESERRSYKKAGGMLGNVNTITPGDLVIN